MTGKLLTVNDGALDHDLMIELDGAKVTITEIGGDVEYDSVVPGENIVEVLDVVLADGAAVMNGAVLVRKTSDAIIEANYDDYDSEVESMLTDVVLITSMIDLS